MNDEKKELPGAYLAEYFEEVKLLRRDAERYRALREEAIDIKYRPLGILRRDSLDRYTDRLRQYKTLPNPTPNKVDTVS